MSKAINKDVSDLIGAIPSYSLGNEVVDFILETHSHTKKLGEGDPSPLLICFDDKSADLIGGKIKSIMTRILAGGQSDGRRQCSSKKS